MTISNKAALVPEQREAFDRIESFMASDQQVFSVHGLAGTGKSFLACALARQHPHIKLVAYTGKAASVLAMKSGLEAGTIHSLFYRLIEKGVDENGKPVLVFEQQHSPGSLAGMVVLVDESSMISRAVALDLIESGCKIIPVGDLGQLPPVGDRESYFSQSDFVLGEIHRQALESPIIRQAHRVREGLDYQNDGPDFKVTRMITDEMLGQADVVICHTNKTRHRLNQKIRKLRGFTEKYPMAGELVMCLKNSKPYGVFNGGVYRLARPVQPHDYAIYITMPDGKNISIPGARFVESGGSLTDFDDDEDLTTAFDLGYTLTAHKGQGSEWNRVLLIDEYRYPEARERWLYTAFTRAARSIVVQRLV